MAKIIPQIALNAYCVECEWNALASVEKKHGKDSYDDMMAPGEALQHTSETGHIVVFSGLTKVHGI